MLALFTGVRKGELCGLSWPDINFEKCTVSVNKASQYQSGKGVVEVQTKTASSVRVISIPSYVVEVLREYRTWWVEHRLKWGQEWQGELERLFIKDNGKPINPDTLNNWLNDVLKHNDLPHITIHSLRHTFATLAISSGMNIRAVQSATGHAQASTLMNIYAHATATAQESVASAIAKTLLPETATG